MPQVCVYSFYCKCIALIVDVIDMPSRIYYVQIAEITVCTVIISPRRTIDD